MNLKLAWQLRLLMNSDSMQRMHWKAGKCSHRCQCVVYFTRISSLLSFNRPFGRLFVPWAFPDAHHFQNISELHEKNIFHPLPEKGWLLFSKLDTYIGLNKTMSATQEFIPLQLTTRLQSVEKSKFLWFLVSGGCERQQTKCAGCLTCLLFRTCGEPKGL